MERFAAKLLFQFRVQIGTESGKRRTCEERIVNLKSDCPKDALKQFKAYGKSEEHKYKKSDGNWVYFEFIGVMDMMHLGSEAGKNEVWYEIKEYLEPKKRKGKLIPKERELSAIKHYS